MTITLGLRNYYGLLAAILTRRAGGLAGWRAGGLAALAGLAGWRAGLAGGRPGPALSLRWGSGPGPGQRWACRRALAHIR